MGITVLQKALKKTLLIIRRCVGLWAVALLPLLPAWASAAVLTDIRVDDSGGEQVNIDLQFFGSVPEVKSYRLDAPPRLAIDLPGTSSGLAKRRVEVARGGVEYITAIEASGRTRLVINFNEVYDYTTEPGEGRLRIALTPDSALSPDSREAPLEPDALATVQGPQIKNIDFRRGEEGAGKLEVTFDRDSISPRVEERDGRVVVNLRDVAIPDSLNQIYDVTDFATPITQVVPRASARGTELTLETQGAYAMVSSQSGQTLTVEVQPVSQAPQEERETQEDTFTGERLSLNFQDIEVRSVLSTLAEFSGFNIVASDGVTGRVTLNLNDVPWDQALALILQSQGLSSRKRGNVIVVAPASELAALEQQELEARQQRETLAPLVTEFVEVKYARAEDLAQLLRGEDGFGLLTDRGRVSIDQRTNTLLVQDTREQVEQIMSTLDRLDVAVRQVQIEARIVIARDSVSRELGVDWGISSRRDVRGVFGSSTRDRLTFDGASDGTPNTGGLAVDFGSSGTPTTFGFGYLSGDILLDLELRALESENKSQTISQPRIITANQRTATISQGEERAYPVQDNTTTTNNNSSQVTVEFKEALLSLEVTPQITPDDRIIMDLVINNDSFGVPDVTDEPPINTNTIETQVLVDNGQTVVLGGILTTEELSQIAKTPLLGDLPLIGRLFRYNEESNEKVELLVFITPRLLDDGLAVH
ncbi:type IV pilus secretin PilQ [Vreelandella salicampi]|uniref:Type IV pilus secretin PilQ n=1 Tax=Vreelandella salicampi TaxID=1449798 RepID=A0A7Z0RVH9_9GAMM|nr:type IV pilus secretin PilQ [Halomonas salicampi]NYS61599.1 type IV pilus secretin PilQ [Halomonas salicampi]